MKTNIDKYKPLSIRNSVIESIKINYTNEIKSKIIPNLEKTLNELLVKIRSKENTNTLFYVLVSELHKSSFTYIEFEVGEEWLNDSKTEPSDDLMDIITFFNFEEFQATPIPIYDENSSNDTIKKFKGFKIHLGIKSLELSLYQEGVLNLEIDIPEKDC